MSKDINIYKSLLAARKEMQKLVRSADNPFHKSKYATLEQVHDIAAPALADHDIVMVEYTRYDAEHGETMLRSVEGKGEKAQNVNHVRSGATTQHLDLIHILTGEKIESSMPLILKDPTNPQHFGIAQTYARRQLATTISGLTPEDDDGDLTNRWEDIKEKKKEIFDGFIKALDNEDMLDLYNEKDRKKTELCIGSRGWAPDAFKEYCGKEYKKVKALKHEKEGTEE